MDEKGLVRQLSSIPLDGDAPWMKELEEFATTHSEEIYQDAMLEEAKQLLHL